MCPRGVSAAPADQERLCPASPGSREYAEVSGGWVEDVVGGGGEADDVTSVEQSSHMRLEIRLEDEAVLFAEFPILSGTFSRRVNE